MLTLGARYVFPVEGVPIAHGRVSIGNEGRIVRVAGPGQGPAVSLDLGNVAIVPGFVNAHTHLDLGPIPPLTAAGPEDEVDWLKRVVASRRATRPSSVLMRIAKNVKELTRLGTTTVADISASGASWDVLADSPIRGTVFHELIGLNRLRGIETSATAFDWLAKVKTDEPEPRLRSGLSPHAPYSTAGWLYHRAVTAHLPLTTHLAELPEELELLADRRGRLRQFLEDLGAWDDDWEPIGPRPTDFIRRGDLRQADWIVAHGNYVDPSEYWQFRPDAAPDGQRVAIAYCPRTHDRFGHSPHPYRGMLDRGIIVCLGTDSLASSPTLGILDEIRYLHQIDPTASGELLLTMATLFGAWALRLDHQVGSLKPGKWADLAIVALPDRDEADPYRLLVDSECPVVATLFEGKFVHGPWTS